MQRLLYNIFTLPLCACTASGSSCAHYIFYCSRQTDTVSYNSHVSSFWGYITHDLTLSFVQGVKEGAAVGLEDKERSSYPAEYLEGVFGDLALLL